MNIEATAKQIMSARHSDAFTQEACEQILRDAQLDAFRCRKCGAALGWCEPDVCDKCQSAAQPKPASWQEIARECAIVIVNTTAAKTEELGDIQRLVNSCIERSHAAQPQRSAILERARELLDPIDTVKLATKGFAANATAISGARVALDALSKQCAALPQIQGQRIYGEWGTAVVIPDEPVQSQGSDAKAWCAGCGRPYPFALDVHIPRSQWLDIAPGPDDSGLLCETCILERASKLPGVTVAHMIFEVNQPQPSKASPESDFVGRYFFTEEELTEQRKASPLGERSEQLLATRMSGNDG